MTTGPGSGGPGSGGPGSGGPGSGGSSPSGSSLGQDNGHYTLTRLAGWLRMVDAPARTQPRRLSQAELGALPRRNRLAYNDSRAVWHANLGPIRTPQLLTLHDGLAEIVETNRQDGDKNRPAALVDAYPGLGKTRC